jgi:hypothetical protein
MVPTPTVNIARLVAINQTELKRSNSGQLFDDHATGHNFSADQNFA